ncbi:peptide transporter family 1 [Xylocopa sonorina]|uniref:peptide transporter family 1 n=1 Tax=Xylocopa sonorina TaxID=1818115 RepID=UPI00403A8AFE
MGEEKSFNEIQDHPDNASDAEKNEKQLKYPKSIFFIISNEFCERFSFYGMRTVLTLYLRTQLLYDDSMSTVIYHVFTMLVYFFPVLGAMLADSLLGKFRTILYLSIIYALGQLLLSLSAAPPLGIPATEFSLLGLVLIALGTGGIKPCVAAFGGDQFVLPQQERYLSTFFSLFYFSINFGSLFSTFLTPVLRNISCFNETSCYSLAFFVPAALMTLSIIIFFVGKSMYKIVQPKGNVVLNVSKCIYHALCNKTISKGEKRDHWLDYADDKYEKSQIDDIKAALQVMVLFIPIPIFWALFDQQGSRWTIQATRMDGEIGSFVLMADQMQVFNPLLVLAFIPLFETCIYPLMAKIGLRTPLKKLTIGGLLAALSFVVSGLVELSLEPTYPVMPSEGIAQLRVFNTLDCPVYMTINENTTFTLEHMSMWEDKYISAHGSKQLKYTADFSNCPMIDTAQAHKDGHQGVTEAKATSWVITQNGLSHSYIDSVEKSRSGNPLIRGLISVNPPMEFVSLELVKGDTVVTRLNIDSSSGSSTLNEVKPDKYNIYLNNQKVLENVALKLGGVYTLLGSVNDGKQTADIVTVTEPNSVHILWMVPQYVIITMGEVMFSVTGLEFAFTQAPISMKSLLQATWLLTVAFGNLIVVIVAEVSIFNRQVYEFFLFAGLMFIDIIIFAIMAKFYKYVEVPEDESVTEEITMDVKGGEVNASYQDDEK